MKILCLTDIHSDYVAAQSAYHTESPDFVLDCGDHEQIKNLFELVPHFYIHGNHEPQEISPPIDGMPLPVKISSGQIIRLERNGLIVRVAGLDGNYAPPHKPLCVNIHDIDALKSISEEGIDILLTHESPLLVEDPSYQALAQQVIDEIDRIKPQYVFSGHGGGYRDDLMTPGGIRNIVLEDMVRGYALLNGETFELTRKISRFG